MELAASTAPSQADWAQSFTLGNHTFNPTLSITANFTAMTTQSGSWTVISILASCSTPPIRRRPVWEELVYVGWCCWEVRWVLES